MSDEVTLFEYIQILSMTESEKLDLLEQGPEYLKILSKDDKMGIRIRAKMRLKEHEHDNKQEHGHDEKQEHRRVEEVEYLKEKAQSSNFSVRIKAKILLQKLKEEETL